MERFNIMSFILDKLRNIKSYIKFILIQNLLMAFLSLIITNKIALIFLMFINGFTLFFWGKLIAEYENENNKK